MDIISFQFLSADNILNKLNANNLEGLVCDIVYHKVNNTYRIAKITFLSLLVFKFDFLKREGNIIIILEGKL